MTGNGKFLNIGWRYIAPVWAFTLLILIFSDAVLLNLLLIVISFFTAYLFYVPDRVAIDSSDDAVISPIDGKILSVEERSNAISILIKKSLFNGSSVIRSPVNGEIEIKDIMHGIFLSTESSLARKLNEKVSFRWYSYARECLMRVVCGKYAFSLPLLKEKNDGKSMQKLALLTDGSVELILPKYSKVEVSEGEKVIGGFSLLAYTKE